MILINELALEVLSSKKSTRGRKNPTSLQCPQTSCHSVAKSEKRETLSRCEVNALVLQSTVICEGKNRVRNDWHNIMLLPVLDNYFQSQMKVPSYFSSH